MLAGGIINRGSGKRKQRLGPNHADFQALGLEIIDRGATYATHGAVADNQQPEVRIDVVRFIAHLFPFHLLILGLELQIVGIELFGIQIERFNKVALLAVSGLHAVGCPLILIGRLGFKRVREFNWFHHLANQAVSQNHHRIAIFFGQSKCTHHHFNGFLDTGRCQD